MKVRALILFNDLQSKKLRKQGEIFEVSEKRAEELTSAHNGELVEVIGDYKKHTEQRNKTPNKRR